MRKSLGLASELKFWQEGSLVIGCDEAGRGALAGPIVAAAVVFPSNLEIENSKLSQVADSKLLSPHMRRELAEEIKKTCLTWSVASLSSGEIDILNIHQSNLRVLSEAAQKTLGVMPASLVRDRVLLVDGRFILPAWQGVQFCVVDGDAKIFSIAAASILAKTYRDSLMLDLDVRFPGYGFAKHKGYGTLEHRTNLKRLGPSLVHRQSFHVRM